MSTAKPHSIASSADAFEATLKAVRIPETLCDGFWDLWVDNPLRATVLLRRLAAPSATTKATPGMQSIELPAALAQALTQARAQFGDDQLARLLAGNAPKGATSLSDSDGATVGPTTKAKRGGPAILDQVSARLQRQPNLNEW